MDLSREIFLFPSKSGGGIPMHSWASLGKFQQKNTGRPKNLLNAFSEDFHYCGES